MQISVKSDIAKLRKDVGVLFRSQIPFASQVAINATAFDVRRATQTALKSRLHKPTKYTTNTGIQVEKAKDKKAPLAKVGFAGKGFGRVKGSIPQADYLARQIKGGSRHPKASTILVPMKGRAAMNAAGNIPRSKLNRFLGDTNRFFVGKPKGAKGPGSGEGIWERSGTKRNPKIKMKIHFNPRTEYQARFPFHKIAQKEVAKVFQNNFRNGIKKAIKSLAR